MCTGHVSASITWTSPRSTEWRGGALARNKAIDLYLVDEIGRMECLSPAFVVGMRALLDAGLPIVATIGLRGGGFIDEVKHRPDVVLWEITRANRDAMPAQVEAWIKRRAVHRQEDGNGYE